MLHHFTTIIPFDIDAQLDKLETWHAAHGQPIHTLNHAREAAVIKPHLPDWIIPLERRFARSYGRDYLPFIELYAAGRAQDLAPEDRILLINSDISLENPEQLPQLEETSADLVFASRMDVTETGLPTERYGKGYDVFSLRAASLDILNMPAFYMGIPWWDYILPLTAIMGGYQVKRLDTEAFHHVIHPQRWSLVSFDHIGWQCMQRLLPPHLRAGAPSHQRILTFAQVTNSFLNDTALSEDSGENTEAIRERFLELVAAEPKIRTPAASIDKGWHQVKNQPHKPTATPAFADLLEQFVALKGEAPATVRAGHLDLRPGIWLSCDPRGHAVLSCHSVEDGFEVQLTNGKSGAWACLGMQIDPQILRSGKYLGLLIEATTPLPGSLLPVLRYYPAEKKLIDVAFPRPLTFSDAADRQLAIVPVERGLSKRSVTCELNLFLQPDTMHLKLRKIEPVLLY